MVDLKGNPFYLSDEDAAWVEQTIAGMTEDEKVWQLFADPLIGRDRVSLVEFLQTHPVGGCSFRAGELENAEARETLAQMQDNAKIPLLISADCGTGADGRLKHGTMIATAAQAGAAPDDGQVAYDIARAACRELGAVGFNWTFEPVGDILMNWRNCLVNTRAFGNNADRVITCVDQFIRGVEEQNFVPCLKHFPGDGWEERDQHIVQGNNGLSCEEWDATFGKVYAHCIQRGVKTIMVGHFTLPAYQRALNPALKDEEMVTACMSPELISGLLRGKLGFNGMVVTDQTNMLGFFAMPRTKALPACIAAGCDMLLGFNDVDEDFACVRDAVRSGFITAERLHDALARILAAKASIGLHRRKAERGTLAPPAEQLAWIGCEEHVQMAVRAADKAITLVKDVRHQLPLRPEQYRRVLLYVMSTVRSASQMGKGVTSGGAEGLEDTIRAALEKKGYEVTLWTPQTLGSAPGAAPGRYKGRTARFREKFDAVMIFADISAFATTNSLRLQWPCPMANVEPWYVYEGVPGVFVSLNLTNHLIDVPRMPIFVNAYNDRPETIGLVADKLAGDSPFTGRYDENVWCGQWDTHF